MTDTKTEYATDYRTITIKTVEGSTIQGDVNVAPNQRVSDLLAVHGAEFLVVVNATYGDLKGKTLFINKAHIVWIEPEDEVDAMG